MEGNGEISDSDSGIILHSGSDSPTTHTKDVTTHTRAMKLKHQDLREKLERCILELKTLCIREAELTGRLSDDYPLLPGEKPPQIHRRIGAAFKLDAQSIPQGAEDSKLSLVDAELALQMKIFEAARKLYEEQHPSKAVRKSRLLQCKREEKKLRRLQETAFQLQLEHGRSSPLPALSLAQDLGTSDDSSLSDSVVQDEEVMSQSSQLFSVIAGGTQADPSTPQSVTDGPCVSPARDLRPQPLAAPVHSPSLSISSALSSTSSPVCDRPPIEPSPWSESSLDQPYQKCKKSRSSSKTSPVKEVLPPLEACLEKSGLPAQLSHLKLSRSQSSSTPSTPEMRVHRQLSLRLSNTDSPFEKDRGRARGARRRLTEYTITLPETPPAGPPPVLHYASRAGSEDSNSEHSFASYNSSPCRELLCDSPVQHQSSPRGSYAPQPSPRQPNNFYHNSRHQSSPCFHKAYSPEEVVVYPPDVDLARGYYAQRSPCPPSRYGYWHQDAAVSHHQRAQRPFPPNPLRLSPSPRPEWERPRYQSGGGGLSPQLVSEQLKSWHRRSQLTTPRSRSLDRQGAVRLKHLPSQQPSGYQSHKYAEQVTQRRTPQSAADDAQGHWVVDDGTHFASQL
ncbi:innate immunity activator b [Nelusetta ayraudi]|uniref:innate immunity activator b n=1 Tax=Nelusetta ayraudi TaxID=303726 RepID=UPI003F6FB361